MDERTAPSSATVPDSNPTSGSPGNEFSRDNDRQVLLHLYHTTGGASWSSQDGWAEDEDDLGRWFGVTANAGGRVVKLELEGETAVDGTSAGDIIGIMPQEIGLLRALRVLNLTKNHVSGAIPPEMGQLLSLETLNLSCNDMTGTIPSEVGDLRMLKILRLDGNRLSGTIPPELGQLESLTELSIGFNKLSGNIPPELGRLGALKILYCGNNIIGGHIPPELGQLRALVAFTAPRNRLTGPIPPEIGAIRGLEKLYLDDNRLTGAIPSELKGLSAIKYLYLHGNEFSGPIPQGLGRGMPSLEVAWFNSNKLTHFCDADDGLRLVERVGAANLRMEDNPWIMPPEGVVEKGIQAVQRFFQDLRSAEEAGAQIETLQLLKVVVVGSSQAGKTSLVESIKQRHGSRTSGTPAEVSTVGIEIHRHQIEGTAVEFYDCAGQIDYLGLHQIFLTRRALYLLVWDMSKCYGKHGEDLDEVIYRDIMQWMYSLHLGAPGSTVMLVANKCDGCIDHFTDTAQTVEARARELLKKWQRELEEWQRKNEERQRLQGIGGNVKSNKREVTILPGVSLVTCEIGSPQACGLEALIARISDQDKTSIMVPPAWGLALTVLRAMRDGRAPLEAARECLKLGSSPEVGRAGVSGEGHEFMAEAGLFERWENIVQSVEGELRSDAEKMAVSDRVSAMEGALWISEFAGQILRVANGGIFLDVVWLTDVLKPILGHKLEDEVFPGNLPNMRDELIHLGVLRQEFAKHLWSRSMGAPRAEQIEDDMRRAILNLGVALPLDPSDSGEKDMLIIMRLPEVPGQDQERHLEKSMSERMLKRGNQDLVLKWRFNPAGPPHGLVERVIVSCRAVGIVERGSCWRYGAVFSGPAPAKGGRRRRLYTFAVRYDDSTGNERRVLTLRMVGPLKDDGVWTALRWVASSVVNLSKKWPGVEWEGRPVCAEGHKNRMYFASPHKARIGDPLLPPPQQDDDWCDCPWVEGAALWLVRTRLGVVVDTETGKLPDPGESAPEESNPGAEPARRRGRRRAPAPARNTSGCTPGSEEVVTESEEEEPTWYNEAFSLWEPMAGRTAKGLIGLALGMLATGAALKETDRIAWQVCLWLMGLCLLVAGVAAALSFCYCRREARKERERRREGRGEADIAV